MGTTAPHVLPYPEPTDPVAQGAAAIRALAERVDVTLPRVTTANFQTAASTANGVTIDLAAYGPIPRGNGFMAVTIAPKLYVVSAPAMNFAISYYANGNGNVGNAGVYQVNMSTPNISSDVWSPRESVQLWTPVVAGVKPHVVATVFVSAPGTSWHYAAMLHFVEYVVTGGASRDD